MALFETVFDCLGNGLDFDVTEVELASGHGVFGFSKRHDWNVVFEGEAALGHVLVAGAFGSVLAKHVVFTR